MRKALAGAVVLLSLIMSSFMLLGAPAGAAEQTVTARDNVFDPATKTVNVGDTIKWTNSGSTTHNVSFDPPLGPVSVGDMTPGSSVTSPAFPTAGTFTYFCKFHASQGMRGTIVVGGGGATSGTPAITANATSIPAGGSITVQGTGWPAGSQVEISLTPGSAVLATATATSSGTINQLVAIPSSLAPSTYQITAAVKGNPAITAPKLPLTVTGTGTSIPGATASTVTTLAAGNLPSSLPPSAIPPGAGSSGTSFGAGGATPTPARTGRNEHVMMIAASIALALGTLLVMITPKPGRHAKRAFSNLF